MKSKKLNPQSFKLLMDNFEAVLESSYDGIYITDGDANTLYVNQSYERITGLRREDVLEKNMKDLENKGILSQSASILVLKTKKITTLLQGFRTGKEALVTSTPILDKKGNIILVVTNVRDVTELKGLKEELDENKVLAEKYYSEIEEMRLQLLESSEIVAEDKVTIDILKKAMRVAKVDTTVLVLGETGVGKEEIAKFIHKNSRRAERQFIKVNCGAIPENLLESELFGYEKGAFTGALEKGKMGIFEVAGEGTVFLDEIGELPANMQVKLLRVLQDNKIQRIGSVKTIDVDIRIIAATNRDLEEMIRNNLFREDLYYRLNVVPIVIPPLRDRKQDIIALLKHYIEFFNCKHGYNKKLGARVIEILMEYDWPGNIRQLRNLIERLVIMSNHDNIDVDDLPQKIIESWEGEDTITNGFENMSLREAVGRLESQMIEKAYLKRGNVRDAARDLGIDASTFVRKRKKYS